MSSPPLISVIVPAYNAEPYLGACLRALTTSSYESKEVIVVDDCSTDQSARVALEWGATVVRSGRRSGPAAARNLGTEHARGEVFLFVDADVLVRRETVGRVAADFRERPGLAAVFGSYDDSPAEGNFTSQFKNLYHHYVHQQAREEAVTFWAGCGAVRREAFLAVGGFDQGRYPLPSIEDIELGYRLRRAGSHILLDKGLLVKHLKRWTPGSMLRADIFQRAVPWSLLILGGGGIANDLNLKVRERVAAALVCLLVVVLLLSAYSPRLLYAAAALSLVLLVFNGSMYSYFRKRRGLKFAALSFPMHLLYYIYSSAAFALCWLAVRSGGVRWRWLARTAAGGREKSL